MSANKLSIYLSIYLSIRLFLSLDSFVYVSSVAERDRHLAFQTIHKISFFSNLHSLFFNINLAHNIKIAPSAGAVEYTDCTSTERYPPNECPSYDTKQSDGEVPVMQGFWGMQITPSLPLLPGPLWPGVVVPDRALSMGQIELNSLTKLNSLK